MTPTSMKLKIKKGATVQVIAGNEKGKKGTVLDVNPLKMLVRVQGIRIQTHFDKKEGLLKKGRLYSLLQLEAGGCPRVSIKGTRKIQIKVGNAKKATS